MPRNILKTSLTKQKFPDERVMLQKYYIFCLYFLTFVLLLHITQYVRLSNYIILDMIKLLDTYFINVSFQVIYYTHSDKVNQSAMYLIQQYNIIHVSIFYDIP